MSANPTKTNHTNNKKINKHLNPKSFYIHFLQSGFLSLKERYINLNSKIPDSVISGVKNFGKNSTEKIKSKTFRTATTFTTSPELTGLSFTYTIPALDDIHTQDVSEWQKQICNIANTCRWTEDQLVHVIRHTVNPMYGSTIEYTKSSQEIFLAISRAAHPVEKLNSLLDELATTSQTDFEWIDEYNQEIEQLNDQIGYTLGLESKEVTRRKFEIFYTNLHYLTEVEMQR